MKACFDVQYTEDKASVAAVLFDKWDSQDPINTYQLEVPDAGNYEPGKFYKRELAPLLAIIHTIREPLDTLIIDAYCTLTADGAPGLGAHLSNSLITDIPIIGVAKNCFRDTNHAIPILRGESERPLFVTALSCDIKEAALNIQNMTGEFRNPKLIKLADQLARAGAIAPN